MTAINRGFLSGFGFVVVFPLAAFLSVLFRTGKVSTVQFEDSYMRGLALGFLLGFFGLLVHALGSNTFIIVRIMEPFWLVTGLLVKTLLIDQQEQRESTDEPSPQAASP